MSAALNDPASVLNISARPRAPWTSYTRNDLHTHRLVLHHYNSSAPKPRSPAHPGHDSLLIPASAQPIARRPVSGGQLSPTCYLE